MPNPLDPALPLTAGASDEFTYNWLVELKTAAIIHGEAAEVEDDSAVPALILIVLDESQNISLYTLTLREVIHREALIYTMPTVAAGGGHILNIDFLLLQICQGSDGTKGGAQRQIPF